MRIVTRPDFDGVVCAVLIEDATSTSNPIKWVQPNDMQRGLIKIRKGDIIANLPFHDQCSLWFDHHVSNKMDRPFEGAFKIAPSAAGIVHSYYEKNLHRDYSELVLQTDKIDSANLTLDEIQYPEKYPFIWLSMTISGRSPEDIEYCNLIVRLLKHKDVSSVMNHPIVRQKCKKVIENNRIYKNLLKKVTESHDHVSLSDFRFVPHPRDGNRFLVYSLFPETVVNMKIINDVDEMVIIKIGHSIINQGCRVNVGKMLSNFEGGGHKGAGACRFHRDKSAEYISTILDTLLKNQPNEQS